MRIVLGLVNTHTGSSAATKICPNFPNETTTFLEKIMPKCPSLQAPSFDGGEKLARGKKNDHFFWKNAQNVPPYMLLNGAHYFICLDLDGATGSLPFGDTMIRDAQICLFFKKSGCLICKIGATIFCCRR